MMIDTKDALDVLCQYVWNTYDSEVYADDKIILEQDLVQKSYLEGCEEPARRLMDLIMDVNPTEICAQIQNDNLTEWCKAIQTEMQMALIRMQKGWQK